MSDFEERAKSLANNASKVVRQATMAVSPADHMAQTTAQVVQPAAQMAHAVDSGDLGGIASGLMSPFGGRTPLPEVRFEFNSSATPGFSWHVRRSQVTEGLSELYEIVVDITADGLFVDTQLLVGSSCELRLERSHLSRRFLGIARRMEYLGSLAGNPLVRVHVVPAMWALSQRTDSYIFQDMSVPKILQDVLQEMLRPFNREVRLTLQREYPKREYCVQYGESDLDFVLRLMQEEGIAFYFEHEGEAEKLVLVDNNTPFEACQTLDGGAIRVSGEGAHLSELESIKSFEWATQMCPTAVVVRDFDWTRPQLDLTRDAKGPDEVRREQYLYPAELTIGDYSQGDRRYTKDDTQARAHLLREAQEVDRQRGRGQGNVTGFTPGMTFTLRDHELAELDQAYLITRVEHVAEAPEAKLLASSGEKAKERYFNRFECIPLSVPFRPGYPAPRRRVPGLQTATVVGPQREEIHTDEHGRIKVQFHWDRVGQRNDRASCWVRVAQAWAGAGFGTLFIPRVGMEVVVDFLEGNPDRPLVIGCVYNGANHPPTLLPDERSRSTIRTESYPGGGGYNELRFEDAKGEEQVFLHAQKDLVEEVEHDHRTEVRHDQTNTITANQTESVGGNQSMTVVGNRTKTVQKDETTTVQGNRTETVQKDETITVQGNRTETVQKDETITVQGTRTTTVTKAETVTLNDERRTAITKNDTLTVDQDKTDTVHANYVVTADTKFELHQGGSTLTLTGNHADLNAASWIELHHGSGSVKIADDGSITVQSSAEVTLRCSGSVVTLKDGKVEVTGPAEVSLKSGPASMKLDPSGATVSGPKINSSATAVHEISGALVKIN